MNHSFKLPLSTANARKLVYAASITRSDIDPRINEIAQADLLTLEMVKSHATQEMSKYVTSDNLDWYQLIRDFDYRGGLLHKNPVKVLTQIMIAARMSGQPILLVTSNNYDVSIHLASQVSGYLGLTYGIHSDQTSDHLLSRDVLITNSTNISELIKTQRHRVCVVLANIGQHGQTSYLTANQKYLGYEFNKMMIGGHLGFGAKDWSINGYVLESLVGCLQIEKVSHIFDMSTRATVDCRDYGFKNLPGTLPVAKMFGIHSDNMKDCQNSDSEKYDFEDDITVETDHTPF